MKKTLLAAMLAALGLSACSSLDGKSPHEMVGISVDRSFSKDTSYNFESTSRVFISEKNQGLAPQIAAQSELRQQQKTAEDSLPEANEDKKPSPKDKSAKKNNKEEKEIEAAAEVAEMLTNLGAKGADWSQKYPVITKYIQNYRLNMNGAVDLRRQKIEVVPELASQNHNESSSMKMPILIDGENMSVTVDLPATIPVVLDFVLKDVDLRKRLSEQPVEIAWKDMEQQEIPLKSAVKAFVKASFTAYKAVPPQAYQAAQMDEFGKRAGAKHRIDIVWNKENLNAFYKAFKHDFDSELTRMQKAGMDEGATEQGYEKARNFVGSLVSEMTGQENQGASGGVVSGLVAQAAPSMTGRADEFEKMFGSPMVESMYLDGKGRMVARRSYMQANGKEKAFNLEINITLNRFGNPVFTFKPNKGKTVGFKELQNAFKDGIGNASQNEAATEMADDRETPKPARKK